jgi:hypothetical protein
MCKINSGYYKSRVDYKKLNRSATTLHDGEQFPDIIFQSRSAEKISIKVCLKIFSQGSIEKIKSGFD